MSAEEAIKNYQDILRQYNILNQIAKTVASTLDLNELLRIILTGVTLGYGFGFNRAFLFLIDRNANQLSGRMAIGPSSSEEAWKIWSEVQQTNYSLEEFLNSEKFEIEKNYSALDEKIRQIIIPLETGKLIAQCLEDGIPRNIDLTRDEISGYNGFITDKNIIEQILLDYIDYPKFCMIPLISRTKKVGILIVDNKYNHREITEEDINYLLMLSQFAASSIRNTIIYNDLKDSTSALTQLNTKLSYLKDYNEKIIESIPVSIIVVDSNFTVTMCNENCGEIMGSNKDSIIGKNIDLYQINIDGINLIDEVRIVMLEKKAEGFYKVSISINNITSENVFDIILVPFKFSEESPEGVVIIIEDITKTVKLEQALNEAKKLSELGRLSATVAHEIRNPLIAIGGYANRVKKKYIEGKGIDSKNLDIITDEVGRLEKIVNEILDYAAERKIEFFKVNISKLLGECVSLAEIAAEQNNIKIIFDCGKDLIYENNLFVNGYQDGLKQAFINVLNNAVEASKTRDKVKICVKIEETETDRWISTSINNSAVLQDIGDIHNIFLPFYTTKTKGTGLGLTITKRIIEHQNGKIEVESNIENGTTFIIKLPLLES